MAWTDDLPAVELAPAALIAGVNWWLNDHPEDVVALVADGQDALILASDAEKIVWVNPDGKVQTTQVRWYTVHVEEEEDD
jgi:hypothetical protein